MPVDRACSNSFYFKSLQRNRGTAWPDAPATENDRRYAAVVDRAWDIRPLGRCYLSCKCNQRRTPSHRELMWRVVMQGARVNSVVMPRLGEVALLQQRPAITQDERGCGRAVHPSASNSALASCRSTVSMPSVNQA